MRDFAVKRLAMAATLLLTLMLGLLGNSPASAQDDPTCADYGTYDEAYAAFEEFGGPEVDPYGFDPDADGYSCEDIADAPAQAETAPPDAWSRSDEGTTGESGEGTGIGPIIGTFGGPDEATGDTTVPADIQMPATGTGPIDTGSASLMTMLMAMAAVVALLFSAVRLTRRER